MLQIDPNQAKAHYGLARAYLASKQAQRAYWELQETVRLDPKNLDARLEYAQFLLLGKKDELEEAIKQADEVIAADPERLAALLLKGRALQSLERQDEALAVYEQATEKAPKDAAPLLLLATLHRERGELAKAEELFRKLAEVSPGFPAYAALAGFLGADRARDAETEALYRTALEKAEEKEKAAAHAALANFYYSRERFADAERVLRDGIDAVEDDLDLIYTLARFYHGRGDTKQADAMIQRATQAHPDGPQALPRAVGLPRSQRRPRRRAGRHRGRARRRRPTTSPRGCARPSCWSTSASAGRTRRASPRAARSSARCSPARRRTPRRCS